jgi:hypothetical protein
VLLAHPTPGSILRGVCSKVASREGTIKRDVNLRRSALRTSGYSTRIPPGIQAEQSRESR